jgi:hypothetical protein
MRKYHRLYNPAPSPGLLETRRGPLRVNAYCRRNSRLPNLRRALRNNPEEVKGGEGGETMAIGDPLLGSRRTAGMIGRSGDPGIAGGSLGDIDWEGATAAARAKHRSQEHTDTDITEFTLPPAKPGGPTEKERKTRAWGTWEDEGEWRRSTFYPASVMYIPPQDPPLTGIGRDGQEYTGDATWWTWVLFDNNKPPKVITEPKECVPLIRTEPNFASAKATAREALRCWATPAIETFAKRSMGFKALPDRRTVDAVILPHFQLARFTAYDPEIGGFRGHEAPQVTIAPGSEGEVQIKTWSEPAGKKGRTYYSQVYIVDPAATERAGETRWKRYGEEVGVTSETEESPDVTRSRRAAALRGAKIAERAVGERFEADLEAISPAELEEFERQLRAAMAARKKNPGYAGVVGASPVYMGRSATAVRNAAQIAASAVVGDLAYEQAGPMQRRKMVRNFGRGTPRRNPLIGAPGTMLKNIPAAELTPEGDMMLGQFIIPENPVAAARMGYWVGVLSGIQRCGPGDVLKRRQLRNQVAEQLVQQATQGFMGIIEGGAGRPVRGVVLEGRS